MRRFSLLAAGAVACGTFVAAGTPVLAQNDPPPDPGAVVAPAVSSTSTVTLPLLGAPLVIDVATDAGGGLVGVSLNQADDYTADKVKPNRVAFVNDAGTTRVKVAGHWGGQHVTARASTLADISGPGSWSGDVFGDGQPTTVDFVVGAGGEGGPDLTGVNVASAATFEVGATQYKDGTWRGKRSQVAWVDVRFEQNGQSRTLTVSAVLVTNDDGSTSKVVVGLSGVRGREVAAGEAVGPHTWSGALCDGTPASITYNVAEDGTIGDVVATPDAQVAAKGDRAWVAFSRHEAVALSTSDRGWHGRGGGEPAADTLAVGSSEWFRCQRTDPAVNTEIAPDADRGGDRWDGRGPGTWDHGKWDPAAGERGRWPDGSGSERGDRDDTTRDRGDREHGRGDDRGNGRGDRSGDGGGDGHRDGRRDGGR